MDPEWKKQNLPDNPPGNGPAKPLPDAANEAPGNQPVPSSVISPTGNTPAGAGESSIPGKQDVPSSSQPSGGVQPAQQSPQVPPSQPVPPAGGAQTGPINDNIYDQAAQGSRFSSKLLIIALVVIIILVVAGVGAYFLLKKDDNQATGSQNAEESAQTEQVQPTGPLSITVPDDWQTVDSKLGFTVKAPASWQASAATDSSFSGFRAKTMAIADPEDTAAYGNSVSVGTESLEANNSEVNFDEAIKDTDLISESLAVFGIDKNQVKITASTVTINGKEWKKVDTEVPGQVSSFIYTWAGDHAVFLSAASDKAENLKNLYDNYLLPMTASLELQT
ncbi:MAG TPA: hypothetical protein VFX86_03405 [Candidatus Saccharimonadales bacterium]|nr:hypothetical protein [Candidatus Saccharimonadales bacterium]